MIVYVLIVISATVRVAVGDGYAPALLEARAFPSLRACEAARATALARWNGEASAECRMRPTGI